MKKAVISKKEVEHIAKLANLPLTRPEVEKLTRQLGETLEAIATINQLDTRNFEPTSQVTGLENIKREDKVEPSRKLSNEAALSNAPRKAKDMFKVAAIFEEQ